MNPEKPARRYPASAFPEIEGIRLTPPGSAATLVNLSASGILVESGARMVPDSVVTVNFKGAFSPASVASRVVRSQVMGIGPDGALRFRIGLAFNTLLDLPFDEEEEIDVDAGAAAPSQPLMAGIAAAQADASSAPPSQIILRNRW